MWLWTRRDVSRSLLPAVGALVAACAYKALLLDALVNALALGVWTALAYKAAVTTALALLSLQIYIGVTAQDKY